MPKKTISILIVLFSFLSGGIFFVLKYQDSQSSLNASENKLAILENEEQAYILPVSQPNYIPVFNSNFAKLSIGAKSAVVYDTRSSRILYEKNIKARLPIASLTKVMTSVVVIEKLDLDDIVTITEDSIRVDGEKQDLYLGEKLSLKSLLRLMLIESSNDAAYAVAKYATARNIDLVGEMNTKAGALGMADSFFTDPAGLDDNAYSSVNDLLKLIDYSLNYPQIWDISSEKTAIIESADAKIQHNVTTTNRLLGFLTDIIGGKTGRTDGALECLILITQVPNYPSKVVSIVLGSNDRFGDTQKLIDWTRQAYSWNQ